MGKEPFRFKRFNVHHSSSSMKIGVDAVLLGLWAGERAGEMLEVGTGCGVISLILAQRFPQSRITAIDIDKPSIVEASENFQNSEWSDILIAKQECFPEQTLKEGKRYDLILSNPPYFSTGVNPISSREKARHQAHLSVFSLLENSPALLTEEGVLSMIFPTDYLTELMKKLKRSDLFVKRICFVKDNPRAKEKRVMIEISMKDRGNVEPEHLTLFENGIPTEDYKTLGKEFYLKF